MTADIINHIDNPHTLEQMYRENKTAFKAAFNLAYPDIQDKTLARFWNERLNFEQESIAWGTRNEFIFVLVAAFLAGLIAKIPDLAGIDQETFYSRNLSFIVLPFLVAWFAMKQKVQTKNILIVGGIFLISLVYINLLPVDSKSDTLILASIHIPFLLWTGLGFVFAGNETSNYHRRLDFLRYNGDLLVMMAIIMIAGVLLSSITFGLFKMIDVNIEEFYKNYFVIWGLAAVPIVGTYLVQTNPQLVNKVSPIIAKIFTPLVLIMLVIYLITILVTGKDLYNNREFLLVFNVMLIGVMAIILFSVAETAKGNVSAVEVWLLFSLSLVTVIVNGIALSAILFRISEWGITPNRLAVLGSNLLFLTNLLMVSYRLFKTLSNKKEIEQVETSIASFLPVYAAWAILVAFVFPILFGFK